MILLSLSQQIFYDSDLNYPELPDDLTEVSTDKHFELLTAINSGCVVFSDLSYSDPKPSQFHKWNGTDWIDPRTEEEKLAYKRSLLPPLTKRQFSLYLYDIGKYEQVMDALNANPRYKIEFDTVSVVERNNPTVSAMGQILEWDGLTIDEKWKEASKL